MGEEVAEAEDGEEEDDGFRALDVSACRARSRESGRQKSRGSVQADLRGWTLRQSGELPWRTILWSHP
jgi:hypothetical protein